MLSHIKGYANRRRKPLPFESRANKGWSYVYKGAKKKVSLFHNVIYVIYKLISFIKTFDTENKIIYQNLLNFTILFDKSQYIQLNQVLEI